MLEWLRTRSKRDLVLSLVIAGAFAMLASVVTLRLIRAPSFVSEYAFDGSDAGGVVFDRRFDVAPGARLIVRVSDIDVAVSTTPGSEASVRVEMDDGEAASSDVLERIGFTVRRTSEGLEITTESDGSRWQGMGDDYDLSLMVEIPSRFDVDVRTGDGDVAVAGIEGRVHLQTGDGDIALASAMGPDVLIQTGDGDVALGSVKSGDVGIQTGDGDVVLGPIDAGDVTVRTGDGDIAIQELSGALRASTGDGDVMVRIGRFAGLEIHTGDGDVTLAAPAGLAADLDLVGTEFFLADAFALPGQLDTRRLTGRLNGGGPELSVRVGDGTIRVVER